MDDRANWCLKVDGAGIGDGMVRVDEAYLQGTDLDFITVMHFVQRVIRNVVFLQFPFDEATDELRRIDRDIDFVQ